MCDPHQLENAILNLAINARDAMPAGGTLVIRTANTVGHDEAPDAHAGTEAEYVSIRVTDTAPACLPR